MTTPKTENGHNLREALREAREKAQQQAAKEMAEPRTEDYFQAEIRLKSVAAALGTIANMITGVQYMSPQETEEAIREGAETAIRVNSVLSPARPPESE